MFLEHEGLGIVALPPWLSFDPDVAIEPSAAMRQREFSQSLRRIDDAFADRWIDLLDLLHPVDQGRELRVQGKERLNRRNRPAAALTARDPFCALRRTQADGKQHIQLILRRRHDVWRQTHSHPAPFGRA